MSNEAARVVWRLSRLVPGLLLFLACPFFSSESRAQATADELWEVPQLVGLTVAQARLKLIDEDVPFEFVDSDVCEGTELTVRNQLPPPSTKIVKSEAKVVLFTETSVLVPEPATFVANPQAATPEQIKAGLESLGFLAKVHTTFDDPGFCSTFDGYVISFEGLWPAPGTPFCQSKSITVNAHGTPTNVQSQFHCNDRGFDCICP